MADAVVQLQPDGSGKNVDCETVTTGSGTVYRQRVSLGDPTGGSALAQVAQLPPTSSAFGLVTRPIIQNWVEQVNLNPGNALPLASATFHSTALDMTDLSSSGASYSKWRVLINIDQTGTLSLQQSPDSSTWVSTIATQAITSGVGFVYESLIVMRYLRIEYINGGTNLGTFMLRALLVSI